MSYKNQIIVVLGHRGSGKSTWLYRNLESFKPFVLVDPLSDPKFEKLNLYQIKSIDEAFWLFKNGKPERIYISPNMQTFDLFCGIVLAKRNMTLVVDEVDHYSNNWFISKHFKTLVKYGRHREVNLVMVARRPKELHPMLRSQASRFIIFPLGGEDVKELTYNIGKEAFKVQSLRQGNTSTEYLDFNFQTKSSEVKNFNFELDLKTP